MELAIHKTELLVLKGPRCSRSLEITIMGHKITQSTQVKYLGAVLQKNMVISKHIDYVLGRVAAKQAALAGLMPNVGTPSYHTRRVLWAVVQSVVTYAASVWSEILRKHKYKQQMVSLQRKSLVRIISAYRTGTAEAAQVVAGCPPIDLVVAERCFLYMIGGGQQGNRRMARRRTARRWQELWDRCVVSDENEWRVLHIYISGVMKCKEVKDRARQGQGTVVDGKANGA